MTNIEDLTDEELVDLDRDLMKQRALDDLYFLNKEILKHGDMKPATHGEFCSLVNEWDDKFSLFLLPRGTFKSSILAEGYVIQTLLRDPNKFVLVYEETYGKALDRVRAIREHFEKDIIPIFGNIKDKSFWREDGFKIAGRTVRGKEASVTPSGIDKPATGYHYDLIICDDLVGEINSNTADQLAKVKRRVEELLSILNPGGRIIILGTIWSEEDLYCEIIKNEGIKTSKDWDRLLKEKILKGKDYNIYIRQAKDENGFFFPERLGDEALEKISRGQSSNKHKMQYYNDPRRLANCVFTTDMREKAKEKWAAARKGGNGKPLTLERYIFVDPAESQTARADYTGIGVIGVDKKDDWYILEAMQVKLDTEEMQDAIITLRNQYLPRVTSIESKGFQKVIIQWLRKRIREMGLYFKIYEYEPGNKVSKKNRIETLLPRFKTGTIAYSEDMVELDQQLRKYPDFTSREHDDILDALAQATTVIKKNIPLPVAPEDMKEGVKQLFLPVSG